MPTKQILLLFNEPNNHPLNTLLIKFTSHYWPHSLPMLRLHSFTAGILIPLLTAGVAWLLTRRRGIAVISIILCSMHAGLIYYSQVARGYSMEIMFVMLFLLLLLFFHHKTGIMEKIIIMSAMVISFSLACFSQPTAIMFLSPIMLIYICHLLYRQWDSSITVPVNIANIVKRNPVLIMGFAVITLFAFWLYIMHYSSFKAAVPSGEGTVIHSLADVPAAISAISKKLLPWYILVAIPGCLIIRRRRFLLLSGLIFILPAFLVGIALKFGPPRVYTPLVPGLIIIAAAGFYNMTVIAGRYRNALSLLLPLTLTIYTEFTYQSRYFTWSEVSFTRTVKWLDKYFPLGNAYHCYPPNVGLKISYYFPEEVTTTIQPLNSNVLFIYAGQPAEIKALNKNGHVVTKKIPFKTAAVNIDNRPVCHDITVSFYSLKRLAPKSNRRAGIMIAEIPLQSYRVAKAAVGFLRSGSGDWALLNCWFCPVRKTKKHERVISYQLITDNCHWSTEKLLNIEQKSHGRIIFYQLTPILFSGAQLPINRSPQAGQADTPGSNCKSPTVIR